MKKYRVGNNTDYQNGDYETDNYDDAARVWRAIRPRRDAGNRYAAWFISTCEVCGGDNDEARGVMTCACADVAIHPHPGRA